MYNPWRYRACLSLLSQANVSSIPCQCTNDPPPPISPETDESPSGDLERTRNRLGPLPCIPYLGWRLPNHCTLFILHCTLLDFHLLRQRKGLGNRPILLRLTVLQLRFEHLVERGPDGGEISFSVALHVLRG